jgi:hypothetical protein
MSINTSRPRAASAAALLAGASCAFLAVVNAPTGAPVASAQQQSALTKKHRARWKIWVPAWWQSIRVGARS